MSAPTAISSSVGRRPALDDRERDDPVDAVDGTKAWTQPDLVADLHVRARDAGGSVDVGDERVVGEGLRPRIVADRGRTRSRGPTVRRTARGCRRGRRGWPSGARRGHGDHDAGADAGESGALLDAAPGRPRRARCTAARQHRRERPRPRSGRVAVLERPRDGGPDRGGAGTALAAATVISSASAPTDQHETVDADPGSTSAARPMPTGPSGERATAVTHASAIAGTLMARLRTSAAMPASPLVTRWRGGPARRPTPAGSGGRSAGPTKARPRRATTTPSAITAWASYRIASRVGSISSAPSAGARLNGWSANASSIAAWAAAASSSVASTSTPENPPASGVAFASPGPAYTRTSSSAAEARPGRRPGR